MGNAKRHLNYANVMATVALVIAVAGGTTAIAVSKSAKTPDVNKKGNIRAARVTTPKLADGNVTAAKLAGVDLVQSTGTASAQVACPAGEPLLGGGGAIPGGGTAALQTSRPLGNGWQAGQSAAMGNVSVTAYALCAKN